MAFNITVTSYVHSDVHLSVFLKISMNATALMTVMKMLSVTTPLAATPVLAMLDMLEMD